RHASADSGNCSSAATCKKPPRGATNTPDTQTRTRQRSLMSERSPRDARPTHRRSSVLGLRPPRGRTGNPGRAARSSGGVAGAGPLVGAPSATGRLFVDVCRRRKDAVIRFESVSKRYPDGTLAVAGLSLEAPSEEITVLVGPSGCGKTTALRMINRMIEPTSGRVWLDGRDTASIRPVELRRGIGYVIQQAGLFPHKTVLDNIATVPLLLGERKRDARRRAEALLDRVGVPAELAKRYPAQLSGGQQQRVGVARALAADPSVMLMDEPFSAVDPVVREQLQNEFLHLQRELGKTIVFVTHDIDEAIKLGDHVAVMRAGGTLAQLAPPADLLSRPADGFVAAFI